MRDTLSHLWGMNNIRAQSTYVLLFQFVSTLSNGVPMKKTLLRIAVALCAAAVYSATAGPSQQEDQAAQQMKTASTAPPPVMIKTWLPTPWYLQRVPALLEANAFGITKMDQVALNPLDLKHGGGSGGMLDPRLVPLAKNGGGSGGVTSIANGGGSRWIDHQKSGRFVGSSGYLVGAGEAITSTCKDLSG